MISTSMPRASSRLEVTIYLIALHRKHADFRLESHSLLLRCRLVRLVSPDDASKAANRNLLTGFVFDDVVNLLRSKTCGSLMNRANPL